MQLNLKIKRHEKAYALCKTLLALSPALILLSACGRLDFESRTSTAAPIYSLQDPNAAIVDENGNYGNVANRSGRYECPSDPNVMPGGYDFDGNGSRRYRACKPQNEAAARVLLHGYTAGATRICVFPALEMSSVDVRAILEGGSGQAKRKCIELTRGQTQENGLEVLLEGTEFNAIFVTEGADDDRMDYCLRTDTIGAADCPRYSYGKFR